VEYIKTEEQVASSLCAVCGGWCCKIYKSSPYGTRNSEVYWEEWVTEFHGDRKLFGVEPLYDAYLIHLDYYQFYGITDEETIQEYLAKGIDIRGYQKKYDDAVAALAEKGINVAYCEYHGKNGCIIPIEVRPDTCKSWYCKKFARYRLSSDEYAVLVERGTRCKIARFVASVVYVDTDGCHYVDEMFFEEALACDGDTFRATLPYQN